MTSFLTPFKRGFQDFVNFVIKWLLVIPKSM